MGQHVIHCFVGAHTDVTETRGTSRELLRAMGRSFHFVVLCTLHMFNEANLIEKISRRHHYVSFSVAFRSTSEQ